MVLLGGAGLTLICVGEASLGGVLLLCVAGPFDDGGG